MIRRFKITEEQFTEYVGPKFKHKLTPILDDFREVGDFLTFNVYRVAEGLKRSPSYLHDSIKARGYKVINGVAYLPKEKTRSYFDTTDVLERSSESNRNIVRKEIQSNSAQSKNRRQSLNRRDREKIRAEKKRRKNFIAPKMYESVHLIPRGGDYTIATGIPTSYQFGSLGKLNGDIITKTSIEDIMRSRHLSKQEVVSIFAKMSIYQEDKNEKDVKKSLFFDIDQLKEFYEIDKISHRPKRKGHQNFKRKERYFKDFSQFQIPQIVKPELLNYPLIPSGSEFFALFDTRTIFAEYLGTSIKQLLRLIGDNTGTGQDSLIISTENIDDFLNAVKNRDYGNVIYNHPGTSVKQTFLNYKGEIGRLMIVDINGKNYIELHHEDFITHFDAVDVGFDKTKKNATKNVLEQGFNILKFKNTMYIDTTNYVYVAEILGSDTRLNNTRENSVASMYSSFEGNIGMLPVLNFKGSPNIDISNMNDSVEFLFNNEIDSKFKTKFGLTQIVDEELDFIVGNNFNRYAKAIGSNVRIGKYVGNK